MSLEDELRDELDEEFGIDKGIIDDNKFDNFKAEDDYWDERPSKPQQDDPFDDDFTFWKL